jgi:hypothetical protein
MVIDMRVHLKRICFMVKGSTFIEMEIFSRAFGNKAKDMVKGSFRV